jgi:SagB-type dehydrogenase family enzyme
MEIHPLEPVPRVSPLIYKPFGWHDGLVITLPTIREPLVIELDSVLSRRRSKRSYAAELSLSDLGSVLWLACRTIGKIDSPYGFDQEFRTCPSAGAVHPVHVLLLRHGKKCLERYDSTSHALIEVRDSTPAADLTHDVANQVVPTGKATLMLFAAEYGKTNAKYENADTLVWRDAGVLLGYLSIVAESLGLNFCPLGITGHRCVEKLPHQGSLTAVGVALLGSE